MVHTRAAVTQLLAEAGRHPRRQFGQNFVADPNTVRRIARLAGVGRGDHVVEIGPGLGSLTLALAETGATITAVEIDEHLIEPLRRSLGAASGVTVVHADALTTDWDELCDPAVSWTLVANLPYNVGTPLVCDLLDGVPQITRMLVMLQREVAERFAAEPGDHAYGAVSVKRAMWATARIAGHVPAAVFVPRPNVDSALLEIVRRDAPATDAPPDELFTLVRAAFAQRRKMLRGSLRQLVSPAQFAAAGIDPTRRPEELGIAEWGALTRAVHGAAGGDGAGDGAEERPR